MEFNECSRRKTHGDTKSINKMPNMQQVMQSSSMRQLLTLSYSRDAGQKKHQPVLHSRGNL